MATRAQVPQGFPNAPHSILQPVSQYRVIIDHSDKTIQLYIKYFKDSSFTLLGTL